MRLRTLPVGMAGVIAGWGCAAACGGHFGWWPATACMLIAVLAQIASNFGNEYFDFRNGLDRKGREGFRRGVTEGDISPRAMLRATLLTLTLACAVGIAMMISLRCGWLMAPGVAIALFAIAYSAGPYPLSHHGLGDLAVVLFFGLVPVSLTCFVVSGSWGDPWITWGTAAAVGILAANVLVVNNYRDMEDDRAVGKHTTVVLFGRPAMSFVYLAGGFIAMGLTWKVWQAGWNLGSVAIPALYLVVHIVLWRKLRSMHGAALNPLLGKTACNLLLFAVLTAMLLTRL